MVDASEETPPSSQIDIELTLASDSHFFAGLTGDVTGGGIFVSTYQALPLGTEVNVSASLPNGQIAARGHVQWVRDVGAGSAPGLGIALDLSEDQLSLIAQYCEERPPIYIDLGACEDRPSFF
jgi:uncharacterized protein (TIGR02266 family)